MTQPTCDLCARPMPDTAYVCGDDAMKVREALGRIADQAGEVETAVAKLVRFNRGPGGGSGERPLPVDLKAAERAAAVGNTVATWARHVRESRGIVIPAPVVEAQAFGPLCSIGVRCRHASCHRIRRRRREVGVEATARWLAGQLEWLRHRPEAAEAFTDLLGAAGDLERLVGRPRDLWYAGPCWLPLDELDDDGQPKRCQASIYAVPGKATVRCRACGQEDDARARREWLLDEAYDALVHAELMARALTALGVEDVTSARIRGMARHGRIVAKGTNALGDPTYRVGDVLEVIDEQARIQEDRKRQREAKADRAAAKKAAAEAGAA